MNLFKSNGNQVKAGGTKEGAWLEIQGKFGCKVVSMDKKQIKKMIKELQKLEKKMEK